MPSNKPISEKELAEWEPYAESYSKLHSDFGLIAADMLRLIHSYRELLAAADALCRGLDTCHICKGQVALKLRVKRLEELRADTQAAIPNMARDAIEQAVAAEREACYKRFYDEYADAIHYGLDQNAAIECGMDAIRDGKEPAK